VQGAKPVAEKVLPATQGAFATHCSAVAFHTNAGPLQAQLVWPVAVIALLVSYSGVVPQAAQEPVWPATEKVCGAHLEQMVLLEGAHAADAKEPAAQEEHAEHGDSPLELHVEPAEQPTTATQEREGASQ